MGDCILGVSHHLPKKGNPTPLQMGVGMKEYLINEIVAISKEIEEKTNNRIMNINILTYIRENETTKPSKLKRKSIGELEKIKNKLEKAREKLEPENIRRYKKIKLLADTLKKKYKKEKNSELGMDLNLAFIILSEMLRTGNTNRKHKKEMEELFKKYEADIFIEAI